MSTTPGGEFLALQEALVGRYSLQREIGRGGMGIVYLAHDASLDRPVALKLLPPDLAVRPALRERFVREARTAARLSHPNIVPIHAVEEIGDFVFYVMALRIGDRKALLGGKGTVGCGSRSGKRWRRPPAGTRVEAREGARREGCW